MDTALRASIFDAPAPPEDDDKPYTPTRDEYLQTLERLKGELVAASRDLRSDQIKACKQYHNGAKIKAIAEDLGLTAHTIRRLVKTPQARRLLGYLERLDLHVNGPVVGQRRDMLWRIAARNEEKDPRVAISAVSEVNKMEHNQELLDSGNAGPQTVEIVINNQALAKGPLD